MSLLQGSEGGDNSNIDGVHVEVTGIAALPNEQYPNNRVIYSPSAEFQKDGDTITSPIGYVSVPGSGVVLKGNDALSPAALPFIYDAFDDSNETFKTETTTSRCEFGIHPVVLLLSFGAGPEFRGIVIAWMNGYTPRKEADRNTTLTLSSIMQNCIGTTIVHSSHSQSSSWDTVFNVVIQDNGTCVVNYYTGTTSMVKGSKTYSGSQVKAWQYYPFYMSI